MRRLELIKNQLSKTGKKPLVVVENANGNNTEIKIVTMNTPLNSLSREMANTVYETLAKLDSDNETRVIILTGISKAFAAGADIKYMSKADYSDVTRTDWFLFNLENISYHITKPIIAAVNGIAYGGGFELALACDIIIASEKAAFAFPELKLGLFPGAGGTQRLSRLMGYNKAFEYILTAKDIPLQELKNFGVVNQIVPHDQLIKSSVHVAESISKFSLMSVYAAKKAIKLSQETNLFAGLKAEKYLFEGVFATQDKKSGIDAFLGKKQPSFKDK